MDATVAYKFLRLTINTFTSVSLTSTNKFEGKGNSCSVTYNFHVILSQVENDWFRNGDEGNKTEGKRASSGCAHSPDHNSNISGNKKKYCEKCGLKDCILYFCHHSKLSSFL